MTNRIVGGNSVPSSGPYDNPESTINPAPSSVEQPPESPATSEPYSRTGGRVGAPPPPGQPRPIVALHETAFYFQGQPWSWQDLLENIPWVVGRLPQTQEELEGYINAGRMALGRLADEDPDNETDPIDPNDPNGPGGPRGRSGSGSRAAAPVYIAPNRDEVEENLKSYIVATTGKNDTKLLQSAVDAYMSADKEDWTMQTSGKGGEVVSPLMAAKDIVRGSASYQAIHELRPDSVDEMDWVTGTQGKLRQLGLSAARAEDFGIQQAKAGATDADLIDASEVDMQLRNKLIADSQKRKLSQSISAVARLIK